MVSENEKYRYMRFIDQNYHSLALLGKLVLEAVIVKYVDLIRLEMLARMCWSDQTINK